MTAVVFYFQVHQPFRLRRFTFFDIGARDDYFDMAENTRLLHRVAEKCYLPMNALLLRVIQRLDGKFRCAFSVSGTALQQMEQWSTETLDSFRRLAETGCVEFLAETSHHSLSALADRHEFVQQVRDQSDRVEALFGRRPTTFRNTELVVNNEIARTVEKLGFRGILGEGADHLLGWRSPHRICRPEGCERIKLLLRSYRFSDDIAFRFSNRAWGEWPLTADKFARWIHGTPEEDVFIGLFMDYETFGEHQWRDTGIFDFMDHMPEAILAHPRFSFETPAEVIEKNDAEGRLDIPHPVSWADTERDLSAWLGNPMQHAAQEALYELADLARSAERHGVAALTEQWRRLTTSDHLYYMCVKYFSDGDVHKYFSPYASPHDAFIAFMNVIDDLRRRLEDALADVEGLDAVPATSREAVPGDDAGEGSVA